MVNLDYIQRNYPGGCFFIDNYTITACKESASKKFVDYSGKINVTIPFYGNCDNIDYYFSKISYHFDCSIKRFDIKDADTPGLKYALYSVEAQHIVSTYYGVDLLLFCLKFAFDLRCQLRQKTISNISLDYYAQYTSDIELVCIYNYLLQNFRARDICGLKFSDFSGFRQSTGLFSLFYNWRQDQDPRYKTLLNKIVGNLKIKVKPNSKEQLKPMIDSLSKRGTFGRLDFSSMWLKWAISGSKFVETNEPLALTSIHGFYCSPHT